MVLFASDKTGFIGLLIGLLYDFKETGFGTLCALQDI
jgi:hypothetical protein